MSKNFSVSLDDHTYQGLKEHADQLNLSISDYIKRSLILMMNCDDFLTNDTDTIEVHNQNQVIMKMYKKTLDEFSFKTPHLDGED